MILYCAELMPPLLRGKAPAICHGLTRASPPKPRKGAGCRRRRPPASTSTPTPAPGPRRRRRS